MRIATALLDALAIAFVLTAVVRLMMAGTALLMPGYLS
jgi:hypothetical protein